MNGVAHTRIPIANAGSDQSNVAEGISITLDGSASSDPDNDPLTFYWRQTSGPAALQLSGSYSDTLSFVTPNVNSSDATLSFELVVTDSKGAFATDSVNVMLHDSDSGTIIPDFNFAAVGDWGCTTDTDDVVTEIDNRNPELVLGLGDYSYEALPNCWYEAVAPIESKMHNPTTIALGNHETANGQVQRLSTAGRADLLDLFGLTEGTTFYSYKYLNVHFLVLNTEKPFAAGSAQYTFANNDLSQAQLDPEINWIIVYFHQPIYSSTSNHAPLTTFRNAYQPMFDQYGVDLVLQAHNHNYQRSKPLQYDSIITDNTASNFYQDPLGQIYVLVGTGGQEIYPIAGSPSYLAKQIGNAHGFLNVDITTNGTVLVGKFISSTNQQLDEFTITKSSDESFFRALGNNAYDIPDNTLLRLPKFAVTAWFKTSADFAGNAMIVNKGGFGTDSSGQNMNYGIWMNKDERIVGGYEAASNGADFFVISPSPYNDNQWHHAAVTYDGSVVRLYIDGSQIGTKSTTTPPDIAGNQPLRIGANSLKTSTNSYNSLYFVGGIDEIKVWNRSITPQEVADEFNFANSGISESSITPTGQLIYMNGSSHTWIPIASAGPDRNVNEGTVVSLDGTSSSDQDGDALDYSWVQLTGPSVILSGADSSTPSFTAPTVSSPEDLTLTFKLTVNDGNGGVNVDSVAIIVEDIII
jgi:hypothetical protein